MTGDRDKAHMPKAVLYTLLAIAALGALYNLVALLPLMQSFAADGFPLALVNRDYANVWMAARLILDESSMDLFAQDTYMEHLRLVFGAGYPLHAWSYPPHAMLLVWPFGFLDYRSGLLAYWLLGLAAFVFALATLMRTRSGQEQTSLLFAAVFAFVLLGIETAQNGLFTAAFLLLGVAWARSRVILAALAFALLTTKPQLGVLIPLWMLAERNWRLLITTTVATVVFVGLSIAVFGTDVWVGYIKSTIPYQQFVLTDWQGVFLPMMPTPFGAGRVLGFDASTAYLQHWTVAAVSLVLLGISLIRLADAGLRVLAVVCATFLISPYAFSYDMGAMVVLAALAAGDPGNGLGGKMRALLGLCAVMPPLILRLGLFELPVAPVVLFFVLIGLAWSAWRSAFDSPASSLPAG